MTTREGSTEVLGDQETLLIVSTDSTIDGVEFTPASTPRSYAFRGQCSGPKLPDVPTYTWGDTSDLATWNFQLQNKLSAESHILLTEEDRLRYTVSLFEGQALQVVRRIMTGSITGSFKNMSVDELLELLALSQARRHMKGKYKRSTLFPWPNDTTAAWVAQVSSRITTTMGSGLNHQEKKEALILASMADLEEEVSVLVEKQPELTFEELGRQLEVMAGDMLSYRNQVDLEELMSDARYMVAQARELRGGMILRYL